MVPHFQLHEKELFEHRQHLLHEAEQQRLLKQASHHHARRVRHLFARVSQRFTISSTGTPQAERKAEFLASCIEEPSREPELQGTGS